MRGSGTARPDHAEAPPEPPLGGMVWVPGGTFLMGSNAYYPEEGPAHSVAVDGFWMDRTPVTNAEFARFVDTTGYITVAERTPDPNAYPGVDPALVVAGSLVFRRPPNPVGLGDPQAWWVYVPGACWKNPEGPGSTLYGRESHPVVHVTYEDVETYAMWAGKALPSEAEWEFAARGRLEAAAYVWGDEFMPEGRMMANTWQGEFPWQNLVTDGYEGTSPVASFPANGYGLYDMAGNVWEWTADFFRASHPAQGAATCCIPHNPRVLSPEPSHATGQPAVHIPSKVLKGGSHLCAPNYCFRYRPAARQPQTIETSACHIGFRCLVRN